MTSRSSYFIQLAAFAYGFHAIAQARPAWLVFNMDRFDLVPAQDVDTRQLASTPPAYRAAPWDGPRWVASRNPSDPQEMQRLMFESAEGGPDLPQRIDLFVPLEQEATSIVQRSKPLAQLQQYNEAEAVRKALARWPLATGWLPLAARQNAMTVLLQHDSDGVQVLAVVDLRPWED